MSTIAYVGAKGTHLTLTHEENSLQAIPASENPFLPGQPITPDICNTQGGGPLTPTFRVNGKQVSGQPAINLDVACGKGELLLRTVERYGARGVGVDRGSGRRIKGFARPFGGRRVSNRQAAGCYVWAHRKPRT